MTKLPPAAVLINRARRHPEDGGLGDTLYKLRRQEHRLRAAARVRKARRASRVRQHAERTRIQQGAW